MQLIKHGHACVRVETDAAVLVIDPGAFTERVAVDGVDAVLITHEHADHLDLGALADALGARPAVRIFHRRQPLCATTTCSGFTCPASAITARAVTKSRLAMASSQRFTNAASADSRVFTRVVIA